METGNKENEGAGAQTAEGGRLEAARKRLRDVEAKRETRAKARAITETIRKAEMEAADEEALLLAEEEHGEARIRVVRTELGCVIVKRPNHILYKKYRDKESCKTEDLYRLVSKCIVYPDMTRFDALLEELPGALDRVAGAAVTLAGFRTKEVSGK